MTQTLEIVSFRLKDGVKEADFLTASAPVGAWARTRPGFQYRTLVKRPDGVWMDMLFWADEASARAADEAFGPALGGSDYVAMVADGTLEMAHHPVRDATAPADAAAA